MVSHMARHTQLLVLLCLSIGLGACRSHSATQEASEPSRATAARSPATTVRELERIEAATWTLAATERKPIAGDLLVRCEGDIVVDGVIEGRDRPAGDVHPGGATIRMVSRTRIIVRGTLRAGRGGDAHAGAPTVDNCHMLGGRGGDVILEAPEVLLVGTALAGDGGRSGANAAAPAGGDVVIRGQVLPDSTETRAASAGMVGGNGGGFLGTPFAGLPAEGRGGNGGSVRLESWDPQRAGFSP